MGRQVQQWEQLINNNMKNKILLILSIAIVFAIGIWQFGEARIYNPLMTGGSDTQIQYNNNGAFGGISEFTYTPSTGKTKLTAQPGIDYGNSSSVGGLMNLTCTNNVGACQVIYSNQNASSTGHLLAVRADNTAFDQSSLYVSYDGTSHAANIVNTGNGGANSALNLTSNNTAYTTLGVSGQELTHGTIKVAHTGTGTDANAAALSIDLVGAGTAAQGIYVISTATSTGGTTGNLMTLRNGASQSYMFVVGPTNKVSIGTSTLPYTLQVVDTASSTIGIGSATLTGCIVMGDTDSAGITYVTALNGVLTTTTTKPSICQ